MEERPYTTVEVETARCTGDCCRCFAIQSMDPDMLAWQPEFERMIRRGEPLPREARLGVDGTQIAKMVVPIGVFTRNPLTGEECPPTTFYRCRNLLPNGDCGIYSRRPAMCRDYPYAGRACEYQGCTRRCSSVSRPIEGVEEVDAGAAEEGG